MWIKGVSAPLVLTRPVMPRNRVTISACRISMSRTPLLEMQPATPEAADKRGSVAGFWLYQTAA
jgi:hypothetical protein